ncbi:MAG: MarR family winged helix-turn-helix transcriptional regulator [Tepidisphaerales bacterium]
MRTRRARGLSVPQFRTLVLLSRCDTASLSVVSEHLVCSMPTASRIVTRLVENGFVHRRSCREDRRQVSLQLTAKGQAAMERAWSGTQTAIAERLSHVPADDCATMAEALRLLADIFGSTPPAGEPDPASESGRFVLLHDRKPRSAIAATNGQELR